MPLLDREEYVEQAHFFQALRERLPQSMPLQDLLAQLQEELLATTKLPMAIGFLLTELKHRGVLAPGMARLAHYFSSFQAYVIHEAEDDRGRLDMRIALEILRFEAAYRAGHPTRPGSFMYQFEALCRNRLKYEPGLEAMAADPIYDEDWRDWILTVRRQVGIVELSDLVYVRSQHYLNRRVGAGLAAEPEKPILFGEKEGRIALANRRKDPLYLFAALQRQLGYPPVPRPQPVDQTSLMVPQMLRRLERLETRIKLLEEEQKGGIELTRFYSPPGPATPPRAPDR